MGDGEAGDYKLDYLVDNRYTPCYGTHGNIGKIIGECPECKQPLYDGKPRTPQIYRQCWQILRADIERKWAFIGRKALLDRMDDIEKRVRGE